jgi:hypothetical protein
MKSPKFLFDLMGYMFSGFMISLVYGIITVGLVWIFALENFRAYIDAYFVSFNCLVSGGLIIGTSYFIFATQRTVTEFIEGTFENEALIKTDYYNQKYRYLNYRHSAQFSTQFIVVGFLIFLACRFPVPGISEYFMIFFGCIQYGLGVYVGRKLFYISHMLSAIEEIDLPRDIFKDDELGYIIAYVNALSTLTIIFVYIHVRSYFNGPFTFDSAFGNAPRLALLLPAVIATPVLVIFNFYPRMTLNRLYSRSISNEVSRLTENLRNENLSEFERLAYLIEYDRLAKEELRNRLKITLSDLPIGIAIILMILGWILKPGGGVP